MKNIKNTSRIFYYLLFAFVIILVVFSFLGTDSNKIKMTYSQVHDYFVEDKIESWYVYGNTKIVFKLTEAAGSTIEASEFPKNYDFYMTYEEGKYNLLLQNEYNELDTFLDAEPPSGSIWDILYPIIMIALALVFIYMLFKMFSSKGNGAMSFGKSKARSATNIKVKFDDIAGADEEKEELREIVEFLKSPQKFTQLGARIPKGVLLVGPPGTGKTLLARAVAGESGVPFLSISGSDFVEMFVGVGASRVRDLFDQAKHSSPCIIFIDEIDAVGRQRGAGLGGSNDEREQTLNQLLVELDGFEANQGIIVLAATNRSDVLDPALLRPGRFDRQIHVYPPDVRGREGIIKIHSKNKPLDSSIDFKVVARLTSGLTGADIENMLNEAAILAARANRTKITMADITEGMNKALAGPQKKSALVTEDDRKITAYHEAGHAVLTKNLKYADAVHEVSIIPRGSAGGYTSMVPVNDNRSITLNKANDWIAALMGGRIGEEITLGEIDAGAANDIQRATDMARRMVTEWGMSSKFGFINFGSEGQVFIGRDYQSKNQYSEQTASEIDEEIKAILEYNYQRATKILQENKSNLEQLAKLLLEKETIYKEELDLLFSGKTNEEIIAIMDKRDKEQKTRDLKDKKLRDKQNKLREIDMKLKTSEVFLKHGIITEKEHNEIKKLRDEIANELEEKPKRKTTTKKKTTEEKKETTSKPAKKATYKKSVKKEGDNKWKRS